MLAAIRNNGTNNNVACMFRMYANHNRTVTNLFLKMASDMTEF